MQDLQDIVSSEERAAALAEDICNVIVNIPQLAYDSGFYDL